MSEKDMRNRVTSMLRPLDAIAVENPALPGTPDVNYVEGWIELKWLRAWPVRASTLVVFKHFTKWQRLRHILRRKAGGQSWMLIQTRREWLLLDGAVAALHVNYSTREELYEQCFRRTVDGMTRRELVEWISHQQSAYSLTEDDATRLSTKLQIGTEFL